MDTVFIRSSASSRSRAGLYQMIPRLQFWQKQTISAFDRTIQPWAPPFVQTQAPEPMQVRYQLVHYSVLQKQTTNAFVNTSQLSTSSFVQRPVPYPMQVRYQLVHHSILTKTGIKSSSLHNPVVEYYSQSQSSAVYRTITISIYICTII